MTELTTRIICFAHKFWRNNGVRYSPSRSSDLWVSLPFTRRFFLQNRLAGLVPPSDQVYWYPSWFKIGKITHVTPSVSSWIEYWYTMSIGERSGNSADRKIRKIGEYRKIGWLEKINPDFEPWFGDFRKFGDSGKSASDRGSAGAATKNYVRIGGRSARPKLFAEIATLICLSLINYQKINFYHFETFIDNSKLDIFRYFSILYAINFIVSKLFLVSFIHCLMLT